MEVSAINTSAKIEKKNNFRKDVATSALSGMGIGAFINGAENIIKQKSILKHPDTFIKRVEEEMAANATNEELQKQGTEMIQTIRDFVKCGKMDKKAILGSVLKGAISVGIIFGTITAISQIIKNRKNKKAEKTNNAQQA